MKKTRIAVAFTLVITLGTLLVTTSGFTRYFGLDLYEIYLNNDLVRKYYVNEPLSARILPLDKAKETDRLQIAYTLCMNKGVGTGRSLTLKDEASHTLHTWTFADNNQKMDVPLKELLQLRKKNNGHELALYFSARELDKSVMLSTIRF